MNKTLLSSTLVIALGWTSMTYAGDAISIYDGTDTINDIVTFDWTPNSALAVDAVNLSDDFSDKTVFDFYTQGSLGNYLDVNNQVIDSTLNTNYEITFIAGAQEEGAQGILGNNNTAIFNLTADAQDSVNTGVTNFFEIYYDTSMNSNVLDGTGYGDGDLILSGLITQNDTTFNVVLDPQTLAPTIENLDNFVNDDYPGVGTIVGGGGGSLAADVTALNTDFNFFLDDDALTSLIIELAFNTSTITPFDEADPSALIVGHTPNLTVATAGNLACTDTNDDPVDCTHINGFANNTADTMTDFLFQADANQSFTKVTAVPEPGTLALLGMGLFGFAGLKRRRK